MSGLTVVFGGGAVGRLVVEALAARGDQVRLAQRSQPATLPAGVEHRACDVLNAQAVLEAVAGAEQVVLAVAFPYDARVWRTSWPLAMTNILAACEAAGARLVFIDNLYQLGPQTAPRHEDMALSNAGEKAAILADVSRLWLAARKRVHTAALRCSDFYGPGVGHSHLGSSALGELAKGKPAQLMVPPDMPHDFAYVPDIARAVITLLDAPDNAFGRAWNMPCAPIQTPRQLLAIGAEALGKPLKLLAIPMWLMPLVGRFYRLAHEVLDVGFTWDRPYVVDTSAFTQRFGFNATPFSVGMPAAALSFATQA